MMGGYKEDLANHRTGGWALARGWALAQGGVLARGWALVRDNTICIKHASPLLPQSIHTHTSFATISLSFLLWASEMPGWWEGSCFP